MEPMMINAGAILPRPGYLEQVRRLCDKHRVVLIFDEVLTGFRLALGGAAERFGVTPDLATYGKALASGWPVSALAGKRELMKPLGTGEVNHAGTFNSSVMAMAATNATLRRLKLDPPYEAITEYGMALMEGIEKIGSNHDEKLHVQGLPMAFHVSFGTDDATDFRTLSRLDGSRYEKFTSSLVDHGLWVASRGIWYVSAAHGERELQTTLERFEEALTAWR
jgi:glutamate-1-semialdehyde 2,1-aminomutase